MKNQINPKTAELLRILDRQKPSKPNAENIMQIPANVYSIIRQMYNSFKKDNQSRISQNKVYQLKIPQRPKSKLAQTPVPLCYLFMDNQKQYIPQLINHMLILKTYLSKQKQKQIIKLISKQISKIDDLPVILQMYKKLLKSKQCTLNKTDLYLYVEACMIDKIVKFNIEQFCKAQILQIKNCLYSLPYLTIGILRLISELFLHIKDIEIFSPLKSLYTGIYSKIEKQNVDQIQLLKTKIKITTPEHVKELQKIKQVLLANQSVLSAQDQIFISILKQESSQRIIGLCQATEFHLKNQNIVDSVFITLELEALINKSNNYDLLTHFVKCYHLNSHNLAWKTYVCVKMVSFINKVFAVPKSAISIMKALLNIEAGLKYPQNDDMSQQLQANIITVLQEGVIENIARALISNYSRYFNNQVGREIVAFALIKDQSQFYEQTLINVSNLEYIDIILETFEFVDCIQFYKRILSNTIKRTNLQRYLVTLSQKKPKKYKDFFIKVDSRHQGQIFELQDHYLLRLFSKTSSSEIIISFLRQMSSYLPSRFSIELMNNLIKSFEGKAEHKLIYHQAVRTLHIILSTRQASQLGIEFKKHLKQIIQLKVIGNQVFKNVPTKMINDLSTFYTSSEAK